MNESLRQQILERDGHRCQICGRGKPDGTPVELHHVDPKGLGGDPSKDVPENLITLCGEHHRLIHDGIWKIIHWDPEDIENGLVVINAESKRVPKEQIWFYRRQTEAEVAELVDFARQVADQHWANEWSLAICLRELKARGAHKILGHRSFREMVVDYLGLKPGWADKAVRTVEWWQGLGIDDPPPPLALAARVMRAEKKGEIKREEVKEWIAKARELGPVDFGKELRRLQSAKKPTT